MTISYSDSFWRLLLRWKGSLWKTIWKDLIVFLSLYAGISCVYRLMLNPSQKHTFERLVVMFNDFTEHIPLTFMLGFYVGMVVKRWWDQFQRVSWPDSFLYWVSAYIRGVDEQTRIIRRSIARYCILAAVLGWRSISIRVLKRFPTIDHIVRFGLMTDEEKKLYEEVHVEFDPHKQWFMPLNWVQSVLIRCFEENRISHVNELRQLIDELRQYRMGFSELFVYDWITIPLVYTQVAIVATYGYFAFCLIGRQYIDGDTEVSGGREAVDLYIPIFTILQFLFYVGWLKVGEDLMNPFGEDDEDFEFNYLLDRHLEMSYLIVDELHGQMPCFVDTQLSKLPHTLASVKIQDKVPRSHVRSVCISPSEMEIFTLVLARRQSDAAAPPGEHMLTDYREASVEAGSSPGSKKLSKDPHFIGAADRFFNRMAHRVLEVRKPDRASTEPSLNVRVIQEENAIESPIKSDKSLNCSGDS